MAISKSRKQEVVKQVSEILENSPILFFVDFSNAKTSMVLEFKKTIRGFGASYLVVKKNLLRVAFEQIKQDSAWLEGYGGSLGIVYAANDEKQVEVAKTMQQFIKDNSSKVKVKDSLNILAGLMNKVLWDRAQVVRLAQIPSKEVLRGQLVNLLAQPMSGLAYVLSGVLQQFLLTLKEVEKVKQ